MNRAEWLKSLGRMVEKPRVIDGFLQADTSKLSISDMRTVGMLLPHLLACAKFVEEHGRAIGDALGIARLQTRYPAYDAALDALSRLSRPGTSGGAVKR